LIIAFGFQKSPEISDFRAASNFIIQIAVLELTIAAEKILSVRRILTIFGTPQINDLGNAANFRPSNHLKFPILELPQSSDLQIAATFRSKNLCSF